MSMNKMKLDVKELLARLGVMPAQKAGVYMYFYSCAFSNAGYIHQSDINDYLDTHPNEADVIEWLVSSKHLTLNEDCGHWVMPAAMEKVTASRALKETRTKIANSRWSKQSKTVD